MLAHLYSMFESLTGFIFSKFGGIDQYVSFVGNNSTSCMFHQIAVTGAILLHESLFRAKSNPAVFTELIFYFPRSARYARQGMIYLGIPARIKLYTAGLALPMRNAGILNAFPGAVFLGLGPGMEFLST
jgi:hypothetical protein